MNQSSTAVVGLISLVLMLGGAYLVFTSEVILGAALIVLGAGITPSVAWWPRRERRQNSERRQDSD